MDWVKRKDERATEQAQRLLDLLPYFHVESFITIAPVIQCFSFYVFRCATFISGFLFTDFIINYANAFDSRSQIFACRGKYKADTKSLTFLHSHHKWEVLVSFETTFEIFIKFLRFETPWVGKNGFHENVYLSVCSSSSSFFLVRRDRECIYARCVRLGRCNTH